MLETIVVESKTYPPKLGRLFYRDGVWMTK